MKNIIFYEGEFYYMIHFNAESQQYKVALEYCLFVLRLFLHDLSDVKNKTQAHSWS